MVGVAAASEHAGDEAAQIDQAESSCRCSQRFNEALQSPRQSGSKGALVDAIFENLLSVDQENGDFFGVCLGEVGMFFDVDRLPRHSKFATQFFHHFFGVVAQMTSGFSQELNMHRDS